MNTILTKDPVYDLEQVSRINSEPVIPALTAHLRAQAIELLQQQHLAIHPTVFDDLITWYDKMIARLTNELVLQRYSSYFLSVYPFWRPKNTEPGDCEPGASSELLDEYIAWETAQGLLSGHSAYPELDRLLALTLQNWITAVKELFDRLHLHYPSEELCAVHFGISDPHDHGRTAAILDFGHKKLVYKPRSLDGEYGWNYILQYLMDNGLPYHLYLPMVANYDGYGFMEFVLHTPCERTQEVITCYEKYGAILAIAHAFGTYDLHHENVIVHRDSPVVIDAEPLFRCMLSNSASGEQRLRLDRNISLDDIASSESVMDIGILPHIILSQLDKQVEYIAGALHPFAMKPMKEFVVCGRGSDHVQFLEKSFRASTLPNLPSLAGYPQLPKDHLPAIEKGFRSTHQFLCRHREGIIRMLGELRELKLRLILRPTVQYGVVSMRSISLQLLRSYEQRKQKITEDLQLLGRLRLDDVNNLEKHEIESILNGDIPRFDVIAGGQQAYDTTLVTTPIDMARQRLERINPAELELQVVTIREKISNRTQSFNSIQEDRALHIIQAIVDATIWKDGIPSWAYTTYAPGFGCTMVHADPEALYDGGMGTAVAIAEAGRLAGNQDWMDIASKTLLPFQQGKLPISIGRGGGLARGLGGVIYGMLRIGTATKNPEIIQLARDMAVKHHKTIFEKDELDELLHGRAGFLLAVIALYIRQPELMLEYIIEEAAQTLINRAVIHDKGTCWKVMDGHSLPNVSHGTAGIAMALARWYELSGDEKARNTLLGAMSYDNSFWDPTEHGWIDARVAEIQDEQRTTWTWCNGRSGGLLARLAVSQAMGTPFIDDFSHHALCANHTDILHEAAPGLCCGTAGALDTLLKINDHHASEKLSMLINQATHILQSKTPESHYSNLTPALFTGSAGVAFALMRAAQPEKVKSMLWFG